MSNPILPKINDQLLNTWGAEMLSYDVGSCSYKNGYIAAPGKPFPVRLAPNIGLRPITLVLDFSGATPADTAFAISMLTDELQNTSEILLPDGFLYWCEFDAASTPSRVAPWIEQVKFQLHGVRHGELQEETLTASGTISADGNMDTPMIVELTPTGSSMTFQGITISSSSVVTIDGVKTTVKDALGNNVFGDTTMTEWPKLKPGENTITMSGVASAKISYYPLFK